VNLTSTRTGSVALLGISDKPKDYKKNQVNIWNSVRPPAGPREGTFR
jgi:hypothetical protein